MKSFPLVLDINRATLDNTYYRRVISTTENEQLVLMSLRPGEDIPSEIHDGSQFVRVEAGQGEVTINNLTYSLRDDSAVVIPAGYQHYFRATGPDDLKLYSIYSPPVHPPTRIEYIDPNTNQKVILAE